MVFRYIDHYPDLYNRFPITQWTSVTTDAGSYNRVLGGNDFMFQQIELGGDRVLEAKVPGYDKDGVEVYFDERTNTVHARGQMVRANDDLSFDIQQTLDEGWDVRSSRVCNGILTVTLKEVDRKESMRKVKVE